MERQRIVIKVGSHVLRWRDKVSRKRLDALVQLIAELTGEEYKCHNVHSKRSYRDINCNLSKKNFDVILVSSGAVSAGYSKLKLNRASIQDKQALAAIGQPLLLRRYQESFSKYGMLCSQILLSADVFDSREHTSHAKNAIDKLLENGVVPIINENDTVSIDELVFGDNDQLSAHVTHYFDAELLVILSDIDAFYDKDPHRYTDAKRLSTVSFIEAEALSAEHTPNNEFATGGIVTKLKSADFLMKKHRKMFLASGFNLNDVKSFLIDEQHIGGTLFKASKEKESELFL